MIYAYEKYIINNKICYLINTRTKKVRANDYLCEYINKYKPKNNSIKINYFYSRYHQHMKIYDRIRGKLEYSFGIFGNEDRITYIQKFEQINLRSTLIQPESN